MRKFRKKIIFIIPVIIAVVVGAGIVYAAQSSYRINNGTASQVNEHGTCGNITNNSGRDIFVPTNSSAEWSAFRANMPSGVSNSSCCVGNYGQSCNSGANACGQTNSGTIQCNGSCSASTPSNPPGYGNACQSAPNSCGQRNNGTIQCNGSCSATTPSESGCQSCKYLGPYGGSCEDVYNQSGGYYCPSIECSGGPGMGCTANGGFSCSNYGNSASCNPWVTCDWF